MFQNKKFITMFGCGLLVGVILTIIIVSTGMFGGGESGNSSAGVEYFTQDNLDFKFIKPLLDVEYIDQEDSLRQFPIQKKIKALVKQEIEKHPDVNIGFYFNDLSNAGWFGINEDEKFIPASLLKLPMLISYYKLRESEPDLFERQIKFEGKDFNPDRNTTEASTVEPGNTYIVKQLLDTMIVDSDNNALELLYEFRKDALNEVFEDLQAPLPDSRNEIAAKDFLSPKEMSKFFLVLYHGSYLKKSDSEEALQLLSEVKYRDGLVAGVPSNIVVSHKYGERKITIANGDVQNEFHDCGIIYFTKNPYKVCIMTKAKDQTISQASEIIAKISKIVYESVATGN